MQNNSLTQILFSGEGGQGIQAMAKIFATALFKQKYQVVLLPHYGVEMRMGISMAYLQIDEKAISYPKFHKADIIIAITSRDLTLTKAFIKWDTKIINAMNLGQILAENHLPPKSLNMLALGILCKEFKKKLPLDTGLIKEEIKKELGKKKNLEANLDALMLGINLEEKYYHKSLEIYPRINLSATITRNKEREYWHWPSHCKSCGLCIEKCPVKALSWSKEKVNYFGNAVPQVDIDKCIACGICQNICPDMAIKVVKKK